MDKYTAAGPGRLLHSTQEICLCVTQTVAVQPNQHIASVCTGTPPWPGWWETIAPCTCNTCLPLKHYSTLLLLLHKDDRQPWKASYPRAWRATHPSFYHTCSYRLSLSSSTPAGAGLDMTLWRVVSVEKPKERVSSSSWHPGCAEHH